jgi:hypothetical protein
LATVNALWLMLPKSFRVGFAAMVKAAAATQSMYAE